MCVCVWIVYYVYATFTHLIHPIYSFTFDISVLFLKVIRNEKIIFCFFWRKTVFFCSRFLHFIKKLETLHNNVLQLENIFVVRQRISFRLRIHISVVPNTRTLNNIEKSANLDVNIFELNICRFNWN